MTVNFESTVTESVPVAVWLCESVTVTLKVALPVDKGVPATTPAAFRVRLMAARAVVPALLVDQV